MCGTTNTCVSLSSIFRLFVSLPPLKAGRQSRSHQVRELVMSRTRPFSAFQVASRLHFHSFRAVHTRVVRTRARRVLTLWRERLIAVTNSKRAGRFRRTTPVRGRNRTQLRIIRPRPWVVRLLHEQSLPHRRRSRTQLTFYWGRVSLDVLRAQAARGVRRPPRHGIPSPLLVLVVGSGAGDVEDGGGSAARADQWRLNGFDRRAG